MDLGVSQERAIIFYIPAFLFDSRLIVKFVGSSHSGCRQCRLLMASHGKYSAMDCLRDLLYRPHIVSRGCLCRLSTDHYFVPFRTEQGRTRIIAETFEEQGGSAHY